MSFESIPETSKVLTFMGAGQSHSSSFNSFRKWVVDNNLNEQDILMPGTTGWEYKVPFWTQNARDCKRLFDSRASEIIAPDIFEDTSDLKLIYGYWCSGRPSNNQYNTFNKNDIVEGEILNQEQINDSTIGIKFYCSGLTQPRPQGAEYLVDQRLLILNLSLRLSEDGDLLSMPISVRSNLQYVGGHGGGAFYDMTHHFYDRQHGWDSTLTTEAKWNRFDSAKDKEDVAVVTTYHTHIFNKLMQLLC